MKMQSYGEANTPVRGELGTEVVKLRDILKWNKDHTVKYGLR